MYSIRRRCIARPRRLPALWGSMSSVGRWSASASASASTSAPSALSDHQHPHNIVVLGGGLTGLTTAWRLSELLPCAKITLYEAADRLGGWIDTEKVEVTSAQGQKGTVSFERGARMVPVPAWDSHKSDHLFFWNLMTRLDLLPELFGIPREDDLRAYIYYPDHLVGMPRPGSASIFELASLILREPVFSGIVPAACRGFINAKISSRRVTGGLPLDPGTVASIEVATDRRSLGEYYAQLTGSPQIVDNILSAMIHGIWGGDVWKLSEERDPTGKSLSIPKHPLKLYDMVSVEDTDAALMVGELVSESDFIRCMPLMVSHVWLQGGFSSVTNALVAKLRESPNVTIEEGTPVESIRANQAKAIEIRTKKSDRPVLYDKAVSTIFSKTLASLAGNALPSLADTHAVTIMVVNLWYPTPGLNHPHHGAGYLIPQSVSYEQNPELALGVLFDSDRELSSAWLPNKTPWKDLCPEPPGTKLTVLLGGHYWDDIPPNQLPSKSQAIEMAKSVVARHLGIPQHENDRAVASAKLCRDCIPQHHVGHWGRMRQAKEELLKAFGGNLAVAGPSYQMPGVNGSIRAGHDIATYIAGLYPPEHKYLAPVGDTGLDRFTDTRRYNLVAKEDLTWRYYGAGNKGHVQRLISKGRMN